MTQEEGMTARDKLIQETEKKLAKRKDPQSTKDTIYAFYDYCNYEAEKLTFLSYCQFIKKNRVKYNEAIFARQVMRSILIDVMDIDSKEWPGWKSSETILEYIDLQQEADLHVSKEEWDHFSSVMFSELDKYKRETYCRKYLCIFFSWITIPSKDMSAFTKDNFVVDWNSGKYILSINNEQLQIDDSCANKCLGKILGNENQKPFFLRPIGKFRDSQLEGFEDKTVRKILSLDLQSVLESGILYKMSLGFMPKISKSNSYLMDYYKAMSRYLYGEPVKTISENASATEPAFDIEAEAAKYIDEDKWFKYLGSMNTRLFMGYRMPIMEPFFESFLAWNGIPPETIILLTQKNLSSDGEGKVFVTIGSQEFEFVAPTKVAQGFHDISFNADGKIFNQIRSFTEAEEEELRMPEKTLPKNSIEEFYISGQIYRLATFGKQPEDKKNLTYYQALADFMYGKGAEKK